MKWNEDKTEVTLTKAEYEDIDAKSKSATEQFNKGYGKGAESEREKLNKILEPLGIDTKDIDGSLKSKFKLLTDIEAGKYPKEITDKFKETEVFKDLQSKLTQKANAFTDLEKKHNDFVKKTLIDSKLIALATESKAINPEMVTAAFKLQHGIEIGENNNLIIKNENGTPIFNDKGEEMKIDDVFKTFSDKNKYLFEANGAGGSGGGGDGPPVGVKLADLKTDKQKSDYIQKHGLENYQKLVDAQINEKYNS